MINNVKMTVTIDANSMADALQELHARIEEKMEAELDALRIENNELKNHGPVGPPLPLTHVFKNYRGDVVGRMYGGGLDLVENYEIGIKEGIRQGRDEEFERIFKMLDFDGENSLIVYRETSSLWGDKLKQALKEGK